MGQQLYFVALIPPPEIEVEVKQFKLFASQQFGSSHALKSPAHITLVPPFWWQSTLIGEMAVILQKSIKSTPGFEIELNGFACFRPRVIYVDVMPSSELSCLHGLLKELFRLQWNLQPERRPHYKPHMTIAFKDLSKSNFYKAWDYFSSKEYCRKFIANSVYLMVHREGRWSIESNIPLKDG